MHKDDTSAWMLAGIVVVFFILSMTVQLKYQHDMLQELQKQTDILKELTNQESSVVLYPQPIPTKDHHE